MITNLFSKLNPFKTIDKYLKLRTVRILREKYPNDYTCVYVRDIRYSKVRWYKEQVEQYGLLQKVDRCVPFLALAKRNKCSVRFERIKFLNYLEDQINKGNA